LFTPSAVQNAIAGESHAREKREARERTVMAMYFIG
jgi:hypothetical protein